MTKVFNFLHRLICRALKPKCDHMRRTAWRGASLAGGVELENLAVTGGNLPIGEWGDAEPHPHPAFRHIKIQRRRVAAVSHCKSCDAVFLTFGHDQRDIPQNQGGTLRNDGTPKRGI